MGSPFGSSTSVSVGGSKFQTRTNDNTLSYSDCHACNRPEVQGIGPPPLFDFLFALGFYLK